MDLDIQASSEGTLRFVTTDARTIASLSYDELSLLYGLSNPKRQHIQTYLKVEDVQVVATTQPILLHFQKLKTFSQLSPAAILKIVEHLKALGLLRTQAPQKPQFYPRRSTGPVQITQEGRRLIEWLAQKWPQWATYIQQFPM
jgi:hypothetical protein